MEKHNHKDLFQLYEPGLNCLVLIQKKNIDPDNRSDAKSVTEA